MPAPVLQGRPDTPGAPPLPEPDLRLRDLPVVLEAHERAPAVAAPEIQRLLVSADVARGHERARSADEEGDLVVAHSRAHAEVLAERHRRRVQRDLRLRRDVIVAELDQGSRAAGAVPRVERVVVAADLVVLGEPARTADDVHDVRVGHRDRDALVLVEGDDDDVGGRARTARTGPWARDPRAPCRSGSSRPSARRAGSPCALGFEKIATIGSQTGGG